jgi:hypothetical protein
MWEMSNMVELERSLSPEDKQIFGLVKFGRSFEYFSKLGIFRHESLINDLPTS